MNPILLDLPEELETERLTIRCPRPGDGAAVNEAALETIDSLRPWMPWVEPAPGVEQSEEYVRRARSRFMAREDLPMLLFLRGVGTFVGGSGLHRIDWQVRKFEIGYWCRKRFEGQGFISEAVRRIARFALDDLRARRVVIRCDSQNTRSRRIAERCGFTLEGELRNDSLTPQGELRSTLVYSMIPEEIGRLHG